LPAFQNPIKAVTHIDETGRRNPLKVQTTAAGLRTLNVPRMAVHDTMGAVVLVEVEGETVRR
jgi:hypothetical protein